MTPLTALYALIGVLGAALIAALISFINLISTKELKVSEFRQKWIDDLRDEIAIYVQKMERIQFYSSKSKKMLTSGVPLNPVQTKDVERMRLKAFELLSEAKASHVKIHLRINKEEEDKKAKDINDKFLDALANTYITPVELDASEYVADLNEVVEKASTLLKMEWRRVKAGESDYIRSKKIAINSFFFISGILVILAVTLLYMSNASTQHPQTKGALLNTSPKHYVVWPNTLKLETFKKKV